MKKMFKQKRFMQKTFSSMIAFLWIFFLGSSVFAAWDNLSQSIDTEKKDISVFVTRLSERLQGVFKEIISLSSDQNFFEWTAGLQVDDPLLLVDIQENPYVNEILALADLGVIDANREKFYPDNYLRRYEFIIMMVKYRLAKSNTQLSPIVFPLRGRFFDVAQNSSYSPYVAYAEQQWWIDSMIEQKEGKRLFSPNKFLTKEEVCSLLNLDQTQAFCTSNIIKRGEFAAVLFRGFRNVQQEFSSSSESIQQETSSKSVQSLKSQFKTMFSFVKPQ